MIQKIKVLVDAELFYRFFKFNLFEDLFTCLMELKESEQIEIYITDLCLYKLRSDEKEILKQTADILSSTYKVLPAYISDFEYLYKQEKKLFTAKSLRVFESDVEIYCASVYSCDAIVTHKPEDWYGSELPVWTVKELQGENTQISSNRNESNSLDTQAVLKDHVTHEEEIEEMRERLEEIYALSEEYNTFDFSRIKSNHFQDEFVLDSDCFLLVELSRYSLLYLLRTWMPDKKEAIDEIMDTQQQASPTPPQTTPAHRRDHQTVLTALNSNTVDSVILFCNKNNKKKIYTGIPVNL